MSLPGRRDELTDLADAFDAMLDRVTETIDAETRFAANASHELRTPHATMRTILEVARADPRGVDLGRLVHRLDETNERAIRLTESLLALARVPRGGSLERRPVDIARLVSDVVAESGLEAAAARVRIVVDPIPSGARVRGDDDLLHQAVGNLTRNGIAHNTGTDRWVRLSFSEDGGESVLDVRNTGPVLSREVVATLPEPFVRASGRTRGPSDGTGLGLAIVVSIVRAHGGALQLWPLADGGLHARIRLPRG